MRTLLILIAVLMAAPSAHACGVEIDCELSGRNYRIVMPDGASSPGALLYAHGYKGSSRGAMRNKALIEFAHRHGMALVALNAREDDWRIPGVPAEPGADGALELDYLDALIPELAARHGIDTENLVMTGFSAGGMMTWFAACHRGAAFRAFIPIAGTFWEPIPESCPAYPVDLVHVHGLADRIVPLGGHPIRTTHQGDVPTALARLRAAGAFEGRVAERFGGLDCEIERNTDDRILAFCTHPEGHSFGIGFLESAFELLRARGVL